MHYPGQIWPVLGCGDAADKLMLAHVSTFVDQALEGGFPRRAAPGRRQALGEDKGATRVRNKALAPSAHARLPPEALEVVQVMTDASHDKCKS